MSDGRHIVRVEISPLAILRQMVAGAVTHTLCVEGVPEDASCVSVYADSHRQTIYLMLEHPSFDLVQFGAVAPELGVRFRDLPELDADNARLQTLCDNLAKNGGEHAHEEARLRGRVAELEAQAARDAKVREAAIEREAAEAAYLGAHNADVDVLGDAAVRLQAAIETLREAIVPLQCERGRNGLGNW